MKYVHLYSDAKGESHFKDVELPLTKGSPELFPLLPTSGLLFNHQPTGMISAWHGASKRQFVITLAGLAEMEASDGEKRLIGPGTVVLADDTIGKGHVTRVLMERNTLVIPVSTDPLPPSTTKA